MTKQELEERTKFRFNDEEIAKILKDFSTFASPVRITKRVHAVPDDPDDDKFLECALCCKADYIVSGDKHLLNIGGGMRDVGE